nr:retrovirus-related Pol polyprotein from transposon TNT 1-94 [Tanacetum cinerariifolium]
MNIDNNGEFSSNTSISEKIDKIERQICEGKLRLLDNDGNPLVPTGIVESDSEVDVVYDETANLRISTSGKDESDKGYGTNSLFEQLRDFYLDNDDYDPYDDDMYENHDLSEHLQSICDDLDITVRLVDDKTLDITGVGDVVLKTSFGISWTLKDARWFGEAEESFLHNVSEGKKTADVGASSYRMLLHQFEDPATMMLLSKTTTGVAICVMQTFKIMMLKMVPKTLLQFGVAKRLSRTFRADSTGLLVEASKMLWADSVSTTYLIYRIPYVPIGLHIPEEEWRGKDTNLAYLKLNEANTEESSGISRHSKEPCRIVAEHGLSSEITRSPGGSSETSEGSENSKRFEDSGRLNEEYSKDRASSKEEGFESPHVRRSTRESRAPVSKESVQWKKAIIKEMVSLEKNQTCSLVRLPASKKASQSLWMFRVKEEQDGSKRLVLRIVAAKDLHLEQLDIKTAFLHGDLDEDIYMTQPEGFQTVGKEENVVDTKSLIHLVKNLKVGNEREVEVLGSFNWPPSKLITEDGLLPERERGYSQCNDVPCIESLLALRLVSAACSGCSAVQK